MENSEYEKAVSWHEEFIGWAKDNNATGSDEYKITRYALECIRFRNKFENFVRQNYKEGQA